MAGFQSKNNVALTVDRARAYRLFDEALSLDGDAREAFLATHCANDSDLRREIDALLECASCATPTLNFPAAVCTGETVVRNGLQPGEHVGPYQLIRPLGEGGMAEVWLARRADGAFKREVALKLPMLARLRRDLERRFSHERDVLASLEHQNIARLYDAGVSGDGLPYLAMEYVPGDPLIAWCDARQLGIRERLELFLQLLAAVDYAHQRRVIHRDIKPSNILVTAAGEVRLLDFGISKLLTPDAHEQVLLTQVYGPVLTPQYASPELLSGAPVSPVSDVYSLGIVLHELLTGTLPRRDNPTTLGGNLERWVRTARVTPRGALDAIVRKALATQPGARYASAAAFAEDLRRYLAGKPVDAERGQWLRRLWLRMGYPGTQLIVAGVLVVLVAGVALVADHWRAGTGSPPTATIDAPVDRSVAVLPFRDVSVNHDQEYFADGLTEELIQRLAATAPLRVVSRASAFRFQGHSADESSIARQLGVANLLTGTVLKQGTSLHIAAQLTRSADGGVLWSQSFDGPERAIQSVQDQIAAQVAQTLGVHLSGTHGAVTVPLPNTDAYNLILQGNYFLAQLSEEHVKRSLALYQQALALEPTNAMALWRIGHVHVLQAVFGWAPAAAAVAEAKHAFEQALQVNPKFTHARRGLAYIYLVFDWDWPAAEAQIARMRADDPQDATDLPTLLVVYDSVFGRLDEAIALSQRILQSDPLNTTALNNLAYMQCLAQQFTECAAGYRRLLEISPQIAQGHSDLGVALLEAGDLHEAKVQIDQETSEPQRLAALALVYSAMGRARDSQAALEKLQRKYAASQPYLIAEGYAFRGESAAAFDWLEHAYAQHDQAMACIKSDPLLHRIRSDPRYAALLVKMKLAGA